MCVAYKTHSSARSAMRIVFLKLLPYFSRIYFYLSHLRDHSVINEVYVNFNPFDAFWCIWCNNFTCGLDFTEGSTALHHQLGLFSIHHCTLRTSLFLKTFPLWSISNFPNLGACSTIILVPSPWHIIRPRTSTGTSLGLLPGQVLCIYHKEYDLFCLILFVTDQCTIASTITC